ncbi:MFS transporter [Saccharopolyspora hordei]|uniref:MFS family permease n=1 Tax=Saccharopolyspora hordei TaxID=1838 RepID=A0A853ARZ8_9PSEU|nr:MFS transporter [Saccharopolyspora hordei]NYI84387.1 MFS family permease [Saccharopolyspora hordei]
MPGQGPTQERARREHRRVALGTLVGTTIEWYDFFIYANAAALVLTPMFFEPFVASYGELAGRLVSFATVGVSFIFRPLGAVVAGHFGDKLGRKAMLVLTLLLMGASTTLIGLVPGYAAIGVWAPVLLILLRVLQGFSAGGEWGGAALMAVEHAPANRRGRYGGFPQIGVPVGMLIATAVLSVVTATTTEQQFLDWGWRVPFLLSVVLIVVGMVIRLGIAESPVFSGEGERERVRLPLVQMFRFNGKQVVQGTLTFAANNAAGYMVTGGYVLSYTTSVLGMERSTILNLVTLTSAAWVVTTMSAAVLSDRIGRTAVYKIGFLTLLVWVFPMFWLVDTEDPVLLAVALLVFSVGIGFTYGPQAAMLAEMFPAQVRYSGAGLSYAFGAVLGGAFAPMIATWLQAAFGSSMAVSGYLFALAAIGLVATFTIKDRTGGPLGADALDIPGAAELSAAARR